MTMDGDYHGRSGGYGGGGSGGGGYGGGGGGRSFGRGGGNRGPQGYPHRDEKSGGYRLHVSNIIEGITEDDVRDVFSAAGTVKELWMSQDAPHFGFIVFETQDEAEGAISSLNGSDLHGAQIRVSWAKPREERSGRGRGGGGYQGGGGGYGGGGSYGGGGGGYGGGGGGYGGRGGSGGGGSGGQRSCYNCGRPGHIARDCRSGGGGGDGGRGGGGRGGGGGYY